MRARRKSFEDLPDWLKCCPEKIEALKAYIPREFEVTGPPIPVTARCHFCNSRHNTMLVRIVGADRKGESIELLDLDEGGEGPGV